MFSLFSKRHIALLSILLLNTIDCSLIARECCDFLLPKCNRMYVGVFGGGIYSNSTQVSQMGTALFLEAEGGPLAVEARGHAKGSGSGFGGVQIGYERSKCSYNICTGWMIAPAAELEAYWYSHTKKGHLNNSTDTDRLPEHDFLDSFPINAGVYLANAVFSVNNCWQLSPYIGVGVGATRICIHNATSIQVAPPEAGINHFNSEQNDASWAFAAQAKAGLRYKI